MTSFENFNLNITYGIRNGITPKIKVIIPIGKNIRSSINNGTSTYNISGENINNSGANYTTSSTTQISVNVQSNYESAVGKPQNNKDLYFQIISNVMPSYSSNSLFLLQENYVNGTIYSYTLCLNLDRIVKPPFTPPQTLSPDIEYESYVTSTTASNGSLIYNFFDINNELLETFEVIPGHLDTITLSDGNYADIAIPVIFNKLNNYIYSESILDNIQNVLAAFFPSIALEQKITENIIRLTQKLISGEINIDQFNELVTLGNEKFASEYGPNYAINYVKLQIAIQKYKYILVNFY